MRTRCTTRLARWLTGLMCTLLTGLVLAQPASEHEITGLWHSPGFRIEFSADGRYEAHTGGSKLTGFWAIVDDEYIATWTDSNRPRRVNRFAIHGKHLLIRQPGGKTIVHTRVAADPKVK